MGLQIATNEKVKSRLNLEQKKIFTQKKKSECVTNCYNSDLSPQEPRAFPKLPEFNAEDEFYDDWEPIYNGKYIIH